MKWLMVNRLARARLSSSWLKVVVLMHRKNHRRKNHTVQERKVLELKWTQKH